MKNIIFKLSILTCCCCLLGCQQGELVNPDEVIEVPMKTVSIAAGMSTDETKASIDSQTGAFSWQDGDKISVLATDGKFYDFILSEGIGEKTASFEGSIPENANITTIATYPRIAGNGTENTALSGNTLDFFLPESLTYIPESSNVPMVATFEEGAEHMSFKQIGGVMRFPVNNLPKEATFIVTMHDKTITGQFPVDIDNLGESCMTAGTEQSTLTISYSSDVNGASAEFNVPVPTGVYNNFNVTIKNSDGGTIFSKDYSANNTVKRATLLNMKERSVSPQFGKFSINGSQADDLYAGYIDVKLPYGTDVTRLKPVFVSEGNTVYVNGVLQVSGESEVNFSSPVVYTIKTEAGEEYKYTVSISYSAIPVVYINTKDAAPIVSKEEWLEETTIYITNAGAHNTTFSSAEIRGRGNSTWLEAKKPYAIKLNKKAEVLGMPKHKRWVLLANYFDKTCIRNSVAFEIARRSPGLGWTPRGYHVDLVVNGQFLGNYFLCEQIKVDENRVDIDDNGYLLELDKHYDEVNKFRSPIRNMPVMIKEPDEDDLTPDQFNNIKNDVTVIENALYGDGWTTANYLQYVDLDSFIDYWFVYELTSTGEPTHPKSVYMHMAKDGKMHAGPVWDFDYFTFQPYYNTMLINMNAVWNDRIINDPNNQQRIVERWNNARLQYQDIENEILKQWNLVKESAAYNSQIWEPLSRYPNYDQKYSVQKAVDVMLEYYRTHFAYMDSLLHR